MVFKCQKLPGVSIPGERSSVVLAADFSVDCGDPLSSIPQSPEYKAVIVQASLFLIVWIIGIPVFVAILLYKNRDHLYNTKSPRHELIVDELGSLFHQVGLCFCLKLCSFNE